MTVPASCPVTSPNHVAPDPKLVSNWQTNEWQGENGLFVRLEDDGTFATVPDATEPGGWNKQFWVRIPREPITVTEEFIGTRTTTEPLPVFVNQDTAMFLEVIPASFPEPGCYRITGTTPTRSLSVVIWVYRYDLRVATP